ncbi:MAG TPA: biopolymer transporter ExbD [Candidatus Methylomirabilis sp.]|nr:biopolymer transporter ExbD [Candidatus Methylomirabilis sp.]
MAMSLPSRAADRRVLSEINVTPLVDVMLVLLVIFMVTTPMLQRGTDVQLPQAQQSELKEEERITLTLTREGRLFLNAQEIPRAGLRDRLVALVREDRERIVHFRGDAQVPYGLVIEVMDALKAAGIETVGMITERASSALHP